MHLPDNTIGSQVSLTFLAVSTVFISLAFGQIKNQLFKKVQGLVPQLATESGAVDCPKLTDFFNLRLGSKAILLNSILVFGLVFTAQLFDFPIINGTFGHLIGAALCGIVLGPSFGLITMSAVLAVQAVFLGDGGITALGANIFTMGLIGATGGSYVFTLCRKIFPKYLSIMCASLISVIFSAIAFGLILFISHQILFSQLISEIILPHIFIGIAEALITAITIKALFKLN